MVCGLLLVLLALVFWPCVHVCQPGSVLAVGCNGCALGLALAIAQLVDILIIYNCDAESKGSHSRG
jgi:hypothetical protein